MEAERVHPVLVEDTRQGLDSVFSLLNGSVLALEIKTLVHQTRRLGQSKRGSEPQNLRNSMAKS